MALLSTHRRLLRKRNRVRAKVVGHTERPRLAVFRSLKHISAQVIDDDTGRTLCTAHDRDVKKQGNATVDVAREVGVLIAQRAREIKVSKVTFDRGGRAFHGQVRALAEGARSGGLEF